jgi:hypothetical protein
MLVIYSFFLFYKNLFFKKIFLNNIIIFNTFIILFNYFFVVLFSFFLTPIFAGKHFIFLFPSLIILIVTFFKDNIKSISFILLLFIILQFLFWFFNFKDLKDKEGWLNAANYIKKNKLCYNASIFTSSPKNRTENYYYYLKDRKDIKIINIDQTKDFLNYKNDVCPIKIWVSHNNIKYLEKVFNVIYPELLFDKENVLIISESTFLYIMKTK